MTDQRLRELLEERVADLTPIDLVDGAWERASAVRRRRQAVAAAAVVVVAVVGTTTVVVSGRGDDAPPPPATSSTESPAPGPKAERGGRYDGVPVWWAPTAAQEEDLPQLTGSGLPERIDLSETDGPVSAGMRAVSLFQLWGDEPGEVVVIGADGASYSLDVDRLEPWDVGGEIRPPVTQESLSPDGRYAFFAQDQSLEVYDFEAATWTTIPTRRFASGGGEWSVDGTAIQLQHPRYSSIYYDLYAPSGEHIGNTRESNGFYVGPAAEDDTYGSVRRSSDGVGARGLYLAGPVADPDGAELQSLDALGAGGVDRPEALLGFASDGCRDVFCAVQGRWLQCCSPVGWLDPGTVLFESRHADSRILAWRVGTPEMWRVSDIRGWTPGEESYVASFAAIDRSVAVEPTETDDAPDAEHQGVPIWWSPDAAGEAELPWLDQTALPREIDVETALAAASEVPDAAIEGAVAAFPYPDTVDPDWMLLIQPDGSNAKLDVRRLQVYPAPNDPGRDIATREALAPDGRHLVFPQVGGFAVVEISTGTWSRIDVRDTDTTSFGWSDSTTFVVTGEGDYQGTGYSTEGVVLAFSGGLPRPRRLFDGSQAFARGALERGPDGIEAQLWSDDGSLPIPQEGDRYPSAPLYVATSGPAGDQVLGLVESDGAERDTWIGPNLVGWLDDRTLVYESVSDHGHFLVGWRVGTHDFWRITEIEGGITGSFNGPGGVSFSDMSQ